MRYGHINDDQEFVSADLVTRNVSELVGARVLQRGNVDLTRFVDKVQDQGNTSSCVGHAIALSVYMRCAMSGVDTKRPSALTIYALARMLAAPMSKLEDIGSQPRMAIRAIAEYGLVSEDRWPFSEDSINEHPPLDVYCSGATSTATEHYRIPSGMGASVMVAAAMHRGHVPVMAIPVDAAFENVRHEVYDGPSGPSLGSHMVAIVGAKDGTITICNSWGAGWGDGGLGRVSSLFVDRYARDIIVPSVTPCSVQ